MDKLRWGVLSTANIGVAKVLPAIQRSGNGEIVAIASRQVEAARAAADLLGIQTALGSYEDLLALDEVDAVYIPLPNHLHKPWTLAAASAGKHVLCEKPLALTAADAQEMVDACAAAGVAFMEAFMYRFHPVWVKVRDLVETGRVGELQAIFTGFGYHNDDPDNIRNRPEMGGGALMDIGCYPINVSRMLFGGEPSRVSAAMRIDPRFRTDVVTSALLEFGPGQSVFTVSTLAEPHQWVHVVGSEGRIEVEIPFNPPPDEITRIHLTYGGGKPMSPRYEVIEFPPVDQYTVQAERFAEAVIAGNPVPTLPADGVANMAVIERVVAAAGH